MGALLPSADGPTGHAVVIAGGGPTGLMLAGELGLVGIDVAVVERRATQDLDGSRAGGLHARTIEVLDQRGIAERFLSAGQVHPNVRYAQMFLDITDFPTRHNYVLALWQSHFERITAVVGAGASTTPAAILFASTRRPELPPPGRPGRSSPAVSVAGCSVAGWCCLPCGGPPPQYHGLGLLPARGLRDAAALRSSAPCSRPLPAPQAAVVPGGGPGRAGTGSKGA